MQTLSVLIILSSFLHIGPGLPVMLACMAVIILIHEGGHWLIARLFGFQTPVFSIGFGRREWSLVLGRFWDTEFRLSPILLGGYVSLPEMQDETTAKELMEKQGVADRPVRLFPVWKRIAVALAGVTFNMISVLAGLALIFIFLGEPATKIDSTSIGSLDTTVTVAHDAGFQPGDKFVSVDGKSVVSPSDVITSFKSSKGRQVPVVIERGQESLTIEVTPNHDGRIGAVLAASGRQVYVPAPPLKAAADSGRATKIIFRESLNAYGMMLHLVPRPADVKPADLEVRSIVAIVQIGSSVYGQGFFNFMVYLAFVSINLVIINALPLPLLDGGHVLFFLYEKVTGKPVNKRVKGILYRVFFVLLVSLFAFGLFHDLRHIVLHN